MDKSFYKILTKSLESTAKLKQEIGFTIALKIFPARLW